MTGLDDAHAEAVDRVGHCNSYDDAVRVVDAVWPIISAEVRRDTLNKAITAMGDRVRELLTRGDADSLAVRGVAGGYDGAATVLRGLRDEAES